MLLLLLAPSIDGAGQPASAKVAARSRGSVVGGSSSSRGSHAALVVVVAAVVASSFALVAAFVYLKYRLLQYNLSRRRVSFSFSLSFRVRVVVSRAHAVRAIYTLHLPFVY